ncbi:MAG: hypothetical protein WBE11_17720 [Candidatus Aminicenantaceae bacterium]
MKFKIFILCMCVFLVGPAISKDVEITSQLVEKGFFPSDQIVTDQSGRRNFIAIAMCGYPVVDGMIETVVSRSDSRYLRHTLEYYSDASKNIRIYVMITGPEFASSFSDRLSVNANTSYYWWINWNDTWKTGVYKVTFIVEVIGGKGGSTLVESYSFIVT